MTIVLVILAVLILLAVLFLIFHVSKLSKNHRELMSEYYSGILNHFINLNDNINTKIDTTISIIGAQQQEVIKLTNKVEESNSNCKVGVDSLKHTIATLNDRLTAPIDKINDTHNRIKTLGRGATSIDELRTIVVEAVSAIVAEAVDTLSRKSSTKTKTVKKTDKES